MAVRKPVPLDIKPGLYTLTTDRDAKNRWKDGNHVRWFRGLTRKIGGWVKSISTTFVGVARSAIDWQSLGMAHLISFGTHVKLYIMKDGAFSDITPLRASGTYGNNPITTSVNSPLVTIHHTAHGESVGDYLNIAGATAVGGITVLGEYVITTVTDVDNFIITHSSLASSTATGGGAAVTYAYEISPGAIDSAIGLGYGAGPYGTGTWGTVRVSSALIQFARMWSLDNWGEDLIANPRGGAIYVWDTSVGIGTRAAAISGSPASAKAILVSGEDRHLIALGAHDGSVSDPLLIRWSDSEDYTDFAPTELNTAGRKRLDGGTEIYCAVKVGKEMLVHTDSAFWSMVFEGPPYTFGFYPKGSNGSLIGPNALKEFDGRGWWMGKNDFFEYYGQMRAVQCDVRNRVFENINVGQRSKVYAGANKAFGEVWWLYPSAASTECDSYVLYNVWEKHWSLGTLNRTVIVGDSQIFDAYGLGADGFLYDHEVGVNDNISALPAFASTWDMEIGDGERAMHVSKIIPDFKRLVGSIAARLTGKEYPQDDEMAIEDAGIVTPTTRFLKTHFRARQVSLRLETSAVGDDFQMGTLRVEIQPAGAR